MKNNYTLKVEMKYEIGIHNSKVFSFHTKGKVPPPTLPGFGKNQTVGFFKASIRQAG